MMKRRPLFYVVLIFLLIRGGGALYEDQVGKFDWQVQQLGRFHEVELGRTWDGDEFLVVSSASNAIGRINLNSGELVWRQLNEASATGQHPSISIEGSRVVALLNGGEYLRTFDLKTGALKWQQRLELSTPRMAVSKAAVVLLADNSKVLGLLGRDKVNSRWTADLGDSDTEWRQIYVDGDQHTAYVVGYNRNREEAMVARIGLKLGGIEKGLLICPKSANQLTVVDISTSSPPREIEGHVAVDGAITKLAASPTHGHFIAHTDSGGVFLIHTDGNAFKLGLNAGNPSAYALSSSNLLAYDEASQQLKLFKIGATGQPPELYPTKGTVLDGDNRLAPVRSFHLLDSSPTAGEGSKQVLVVREDCRVDFVELTSTSTSANTQANLEWTRHESLASISVVKMIDLPLSEAQARIETEFSLADDKHSTSGIPAPMWKCFLIRVKSQVEQMKHSLVSFANRLVESLELLLSGRQSSVSAFVNNLLGYRKKHAPREKHRTEGGSLSAPLERDYFNLDKLIIASTLSGSVHGINSENGEVVWSLYLGADAVPFEEQLGRAKFPLHIQRDTSHAQYESQAAVVFKSRKTGHGVVVVFNPATGTLIDRLRIADLRRVELLPFSDSQKLRPLLLLQGAKESTVEADVYPRDTREAYIPTYPVHLVEFSADGRTMRGLSVNVGERKVAENWKTQVGDGDANIVAIAGKPIDEKVHSQGKVLGDRSVLYKYSNPNLIAIASLDRGKSSLLTITLVDGVSGQIIHRAHHPNSAEPVHLVHCENWAAYSFWNDKARRTELGVIELYEGAEQNNPEQFNSYAALKKPPVVHTQSYIFSQGISAMAVTDTERGLTTRALLIAMPFGGVLEISRRFVDARRPLEMTPEMREEMIIPYMPELPIATEDLINYNQTVHQIRGIKTAPSGLESTGLVFVYGLDLFYTRVTPSGTFDILKDDFDYPLISVVMIALVVASVACKKLWRHNKLKQAWT